MSGKNGKPKKPDARKISRKLKPRQRKFVANYTDPTNKETFGNGTKSAIAAGYTEKAPAEAAHQLLRNTQVEREIDRALDESGAKRKNKPKNPPAGDPGRRLTPKEERLIKRYADPKSSTFGNGTKSAIKAGYSKRSATTLASQTLTKRNVRLALLREIHAHGGTLALTGKRLAEGLSAHETRVFLTKGGKLVYSEELADFAERRRYAELVARFEGALPTPQEQERIALLQIQQTFNLVPPVDPVPDVIEIEGTVEE